MIRIVYLLVKPMFRQECLPHYQMSEGIPGLFKYEVRLVAENPADTHVPYLDVGPVHAIGECWFQSPEDYQRYIESAVRKAWFEHGKTFIGQLKPFVTETLV